MPVSEILEKTTVTEEDWRFSGWKGGGGGNAFSTKNFFLFLPFIYIYIYIYIYLLLTFPPPLVKCRLPQARAGGHLIIFFRVSIYRISMVTRTQPHFSDKS